MSPLRRSGPLGRSQRLVRRARIKATNQKRRRRAFQRAYGGDERVAWVQQQPCGVCRATPSENAHTATGGVGRKADAATVAPLCATHHRELHRIGAQSFEAVHQISLAALAAATEQAWQDQQTRARD